MTSLEMIKAQDEWPHWPRLPVKNKALADDGYYKVGIIYGSIPGEPQPIVYLVNLWDDNPELILTAEKIEYPNLQAMLDAGWVVD